MDTVGEGLTERRHIDIDIVINKLISSYSIINFNYIRDPINFTTAQIQNSIRQTWIRVIQPELCKKDSTA